MNDNQKPASLTRNVYLKRVALALSILIITLIALNAVPVWRKAEHTCSWCGKREMTFGLVTESLPQGGSCPHSPSGEHAWRWMWSSGHGLFRIPRMSCLSHGDGLLSIYPPDLPAFLSDLPDDDRTWFLTRYNDLLDKEEEYADRETAIAFEKAVHRASIEIKRGMPGSRSIRERCQEIVQCFESDRRRFLSEYLFGEDTVNRILAVEVLVEKRVFSLEEAKRAFWLKRKQFEEKYRDHPSLK